MAGDAMKFKTWVESEGSLGSGTPEMMSPPINNGSETPASDEVKRTGLQPQVDAHSQADKEKDSVSAVDSEIAHLDNSLPETDDDTPKMNQFKQLWDQLKQKWEKIKMNQEQPEENQETGLGNAKNDKFTQTMRQFPNMMPMSPQSPGQGGPGTFGLS